ncbi:MAG: metallophosphoesterase, partial [Candidatus Asgardarchaeia archaeon]
MKNYEKFIERPIDIRKLSQNDLIEILNEVKGIIEKENLLLKFNADKICFIGDIHGDLMAGARIARYIWKNEEIDKFVFLGDYVDRGNYQLETLNLALLLKILDPDRIVLLRGNHETTLANR